MERYREAIFAADAALSASRGGSAKAWFRRGLALLAIGEFNEAAADFEVAKRLEPADRSILAARTQVSFRVVGHHCNTRATNTAILGDAPFYNSDRSVLASCYIRLY